MRALITATLLTATFGFSTSSSAAIDLSQMTYGGNGCKADGAGIQVKLRKTSGRLVVRMPDMKADLSTKSIDRKSCAIALPVEVAADERLVISGPAIFGDEALNDNSQLDLRAEVFVPGATGPIVAKQLAGRTGASSHIYERVEESLVLGCGESTTVRLNSAILARKSGSANGGQANLEGAAVTLRLESCETEPPVELE